MFGNGVSASALQSVAARTRQGSVFMVLIFFLNSPIKKQKSTLSHDFYCQFLASLVLDIGEVVCMICFNPYELFLFYLALVIKLLIQCLHCLP